MTAQYRRRCRLSSASVCVLLLLIGVNPPGVVVHAHASGNQHQHRRRRRSPWQPNQQQQHSVSEISTNNIIKPCAFVSTTGLQKLTINHRCRRRHKITGYHEMMQHQNRWNHDDKEDELEKYSPAVPTMPSIFNQRQQHQLSNDVEL